MRRNAAYPRVVTRPAILVALAAVAGIAFSAGVLVARATREPPPELTLAGPVAPPALDETPGAAPEFEFVDQNGQRQASRDWRGQWVVVNFWATWCPPCLHEIPAFIELQRRYRDRGVRFVGVALDEPEAVARFAAEQGMNYPTMTGQEEAIDLMRRFGNRLGALPYTALVNPAGEIAFTRAGALTREEAQSLIEQSLAGS